MHIVLGVWGRRRLCRYLLGSALPLLANSPAISSEAMAQSAEVDDPQPVGIAEIVVTARKRSERLQDIPDSIAAFSSETLRAANITNAKDVALRVPNFSIVETQQPGVSLINIRGVSSIRGGEPPIAVVVDGVQLTDAASITQDLFDIERVEVLKGPQGAVYGRNAIAGAINITTRQPTNDFAGFVQASYGTGDDFRGSAALSGPLIADKLLFRIAGSFRNFNGDIPSINAPTDKEANWIKDRSVRAMLLAKPTEAITVDLRYAHLFTRGGAAYYVAILPGRDYNTPYPYEGNVANVADRVLDEASAKVGADLGSATFTSVTALTKTRTLLNEDLDYTILDGLTASQRRKTRNLSQEFRLSSDGSGPLKWLAGVYYLDVRQRLGTNVFIGADYAPLFGLNPALTPFPVSSSAVRNHNQAYAAFGQTSYRFDSGLELTAALRYDIDKRHQTDLAAAGAPEYNRTFKSLQPKASVSYFFNPDAMIYATAGKGFRSGGFNPIALITRVYGKEENWNYEAGFKTSLADRRVSLSGAAFYTRYKDRQVYILDLTTSSEIISNPVPKARAFGVEAELNARPIPGLAITASAGFTDTKILRYDTSVLAGLQANPRVAGVDFTGKKLPNVAALSYAFSAQYEIPLTGADSLTPRIEVNGSGGGYYWELNNRVRREDLNLVNVRLAYRHGPLTLTGFAENLLKKRYVGEIIQGEWAGAPGDYSAAAPGRRWGVQGRFSF